MAIYPTLFQNVSGKRQKTVKMSKLVLTLGWLVFLSSVLDFSLNAQAIITGTSSEYKGKEISAYRFMDLYSRRTEVITSTKIDDNGNFQLDFNLPNTEDIKLKVNQVSAYIIVENNKNYEIDFLSPSEKTAKSFSHVITKVEIHGESVDHLINAFDLKYDEFINMSAYSIIKQRSSATAYQDSRAESLKGIAYKNTENDTVQEIQYLSYDEELALFVEEITRDFEKEIYANEYFGSYVTFALAKLKLANGYRNELYDKYLKEKQLENRNPAFVSFFLSFYDNIWEQRTGGVYNKKLIEILKKERTYYAVDTAAANIPYLDDERIRNLVLVNAVYKAYGMNSINKTMILNMLKHIANNDSGLPSEIAANYVYLLSRYKKGVPLDDFKMLNKRDEFVTLRDYNGQYVYFSFYTSWCGTCEQEQLILANLEKEYGDQITFVSVNLDEDYKLYKSYLSAHRKQNFQFLYGPSEKDVFEIFNIHGLPTFAFINPEGNWVSNYTPMPSEGIGKVFHSIKKANANTKPQYKVWDD